MAVCMHKSTQTQFHHSLTPLALTQPLLRLSTATRIVPAPQQPRNLPHSATVIAAKATHLRSLRSVQVSQKFAVHFLALLRMTG